jgi:hypothetical protein
MEPKTPETSRFISAREKIPAAFTLLEQARDLLQEAGTILPDPSVKVERERDLDPQLDVDPDEAGVIVRCVARDYLEPAIAHLRKLAQSEEPEDRTDSKEEVA